MSSVQKAPSLKFYCSVCGQKLAVPKGLQGQKFTCPNCSTQGHVPGARPRNERGESVKFNCMGCGQRLSAPMKALGSEIDCPVCSERTVVRNGVTGPSSPLSARPLRKKVEKEKKSPKEAVKEQRKVKKQAERRIAELRKNSAQARKALGTPSEASEDEAAGLPSRERVSPMMESLEAVDGRGPDWKVVRPQTEPKDESAPAEKTNEISPEYSEESIVRGEMSQKPQPSRTQSDEKPAPKRVSEEDGSTTKMNGTKINGTKVNGQLPPTPSTKKEDEADELFQSLLQSGFQVESVSRDSDER